MTPLAPLPVRSIPHVTLAIRLRKSVVRHDEPAAAVAAANKHTNSPTRVGGLGVVDVLPCEKLILVHVTPRSSRSHLGTCLLKRSSHKVSDKYAEFLFKK